MATVSHECLSTGFANWCQDTCGWYLQTAENSTVRDHWLPRLATGDVLGGTGMSNTMKAFAGIEPLRLKGRRVDGGYVVNGSLPWVSNLGEDHVFGTLFELEGSNGRSVMTLVDCQMEGFTLRLSAHFTALEGTRTFACIFEDVFIPDAMVIDHDGAAFLRRARAGIVLLQFGMGVGNIQSCIDIGREVEPLLGHVNQYLDDRPETALLDLGCFNQLRDRTSPSIGEVGNNRQLRVAHPALFATSRVAEVLSHLSSLRGSLAVVDPVSSFGREAVEILARQAAKRLQGSNVDELIQGQILAFNTVVVDNDELQEDAALLLPDLPLATTRTLTGCFHGQLAHLALSFKNRLEPDVIRDALEQAEDGLPVASNGL